MVALEEKSDGSQQLFQHFSLEQSGGLSDRPTKRQPQMKKPQFGQIICHLMLVMIFVFFFKYIWLTLGIV